MFLALPAEHDSNQGSKIVRADFESAVSTGEHGHAKRRLVGHGLNEVSHHAQGVPARAPLGHRIEHGDFRQPELVVFPDSSTESHESVSFFACAFRRILRARFSLMSEWRGTYSILSPSVHTSWLAPCLRKTHPSFLSWFSSSRRFTNSNRTQICVRDQQRSVLGVSQVRFQPLSPSQSPAL